MREKRERERETEKDRETEREGVSVIIQGLFIRLPKQYRLERWYLGYNHSDKKRRDIKMGKARRVQVV